LNTNREGGRSVRDLFRRNGRGCGGASWREKASSRNAARQKLSSPSRKRRRVTVAHLSGGIQRRLIEHLKFLDRSMKIRVRRDVRGQNCLIERATPTSGRDTSRGVRSKRATRSLSRRRHRGNTRPVPSGPIPRKCHDFRDAVELIKQSEWITRGRALVLKVKTGTPPPLSLQPRTASASALDPPWPASITMTQRPLREHAISVIGKHFFFVAGVSSR